MLKFIPENRVRLEQLLNHPWLETNIEGEDERPWMQQYNCGRSYSVLKEKWCTTASEICEVVAKQMIS